VDHLRYYRNVIEHFGFSKGFVFILTSKFGIPLILKGTFYGIPIFLRANTSDFAIAISNLCEGEFDELPVELISQSGGIIIDAGGYIGTSAIALSRLFPEKIIVTLEPNKENFRILSKNIQSHQKIFALNKALTKEGTSYLDLYDRTSEYGYTVVKSPLDNRDARKIARVECISVQAILKLFHAQKISLLKLDIEGGEVAVFEDSMNWMNQVNCIYAELHDRIHQNSSESFYSSTSSMTLWPTRSEKLCKVRELKPGTSHLQKFENSETRNQM